MKSKHGFYRSYHSLGHQSQDDDSEKKGKTIFTTIQTQVLIDGNQLGIIKSKHSLLRSRASLCHESLARAADKKGKNT